MASLSERLRRPLIHLHERLNGVDHRLDALEERVQALPTAADLKRLEGMLLALFDDELGNRRRLHAVREAPDYDVPFTADEPLVSVVIPTYENHEGLRDVAIPSILAQSYQNFEVCIVGETSPPETEAVVAGFGDPRLRFQRLPVRGPYDSNAYDAWLGTGTQPANAGMRMARGAWITHCPDDDAFRPDLIEVLLERAQADRLEVCYGRALTVMKDGSQWEVGEFPPRITQWVHQASIYHHGLRCFELALTDAAFGRPNDWGWAHRLLLAGARFGMVDRVVADIYPSPSWRPREGLSPTALR
jgi:O-antigen biosynthesis protein